MPRGIGKVRSYVNITFRHLVVGLVTKMKSRWNEHSARSLSMLSGLTGLEDMFSWCDIDAAWQISAGGVPGLPLNTWRTVDTKNTAH